MNRLVKRLALAFLANPVRLRRRIEALARMDAVTILALHRVAPADGSSYPPMDPSLFDRLVTFCKANFEIIQFADVDATRASSKPRLILSFDDGYKDFIEYAVPIMAKHGVRANQNIIPACIEQGTPPLNVVAQDFIGKAPGSLLAELDVPGLGGIDASEDRERSGQRVSDFIKKKPIREQHALAEALLPQFERMDGFRPTAIMSRSDVSQIAETHELGAHSFEHATMRAENDDYVREDARRCRHYFDEVLKQPTGIYAFPNGSYRPEHPAIVRDAGFDTILLVDEDFSSPGRREHPRFNIYGSSDRELRFRATGGIRKMAS
jgi:peptidoglycan/xylan/chitin deacetylase (PgdA/CDA1 family)